MSRQRSKQNDGSSNRGSALRRSAFWLAVLAGTAGAAAQTPNSIQIPYAGTAVGFPAGSTLTVCSGVISTTIGATGDNCLPAQAKLSSPESVIIDPATDNIFIADHSDDQIRVIYNSGATELQTIVDAYNKLSLVTPTSVIPGDIYNACGPYSNGYTSITSAGGSCGNTKLAPTGLAIDSSNNVFETEGSARMRMAYTGGAQAAALLQATTGGLGKVSPAQGDVYPIIYGEVNAYYGDGGTAVAALLNAAEGVFVDSQENVYIADTKSNAIRKINGTTGIISTIAGSVAGGVCTQAVVATYETISGATAHVPATITSAGGCTAGFLGDDGPATSAELSSPYDVLFDASGNLYIADSGNARVRVIYNGNGTIPGVSNPQLGYIYTVAGGGTLTTGGPATQIKLSSATGIGFDVAGNLYIADGTAAKIWEVDATTQVAAIIAGGAAAAAAGTPCSSTFPAGPKRVYANGDGCLGTLATYNFPTGRISFDTKGNLYVADSTANVVHEITHHVPAAPTTALGSSSSTALAFATLAPVTLAGTSFGIEGVPTSDFSDAGNSTCNTSGQVLAAGQICYLNVNFRPTLPGLRFGGVQVSSNAPAIIGTNFISGTATGAEIGLDSATPVTIGTSLAPRGVASDPSGSIYIADKTSGSVLRYVSPASTTGTPLITGLSSPSQVAVDGEGNVLVADTGNNRIAIYTAATAKVSYLTGFSAPQGVAVDGSGDIYVADTGNNQVLQIVPGGAATVVSTSVSSPTQLTLDSNGNLYVVDSGNDRVVEIARGNGAQTPVALGSFNPAAIGVDPAGDFYVLDKVGSLLGFISAQGAVTTTLLPGLTAPASLSVDALGDVYVADTAAGVTYLNRQQITTSFFPLNVNQTSAVSSFIATDIGNAPLQFTGGESFSANGNTADFQVSPSASNGCTGANLAAGIGCSLSAVFSPQALGMFADKITFPSNAGNAAAASSTLTGSGVNLLNSNLAITSTPSAANPISYGSAVTVNFTVTQSGTTAATGTILAQVNGIKLSTLKVVNSVASYTFTPQAGTFTFTGQYSGDSNYASSFANLTFTVVPAATTTTLAYSGEGLNTEGAQVPFYTLTASVASLAPNVIGNVQFSAGSTVLGVSSLNASGVATLTVSGAAVINMQTNPTTFTATYLGGANFATSTTAKGVTVNGDFGMSAVATTLSEPQGIEASTTITVTPFMGFNGTVTFACSNLPANSLCRFLTCPQVEPAGTACPVASNTSLTFSDPATPGQLTFEVYTNVPSNLAELHPPASQRRSGTEEAGLLCGSAFFLLLWRKRKQPAMRRLLLVLLMIALPILGGIGLSGCGSGASYYSYPTVTTPTGTTVITLTGTGSTGAVESIPITLTIGPS